MEERFERRAVDFASGWEESFDFSPSSSESAGASQGALSMDSTFTITKALAWKGSVDEKWELAADFLFLFCYFKMLDFFLLIILYLILLKTITKH